MPCEELLTLEAEAIRLRANWQYFLQERKPSHVSDLSAANAINTAQLLMHSAEERVVTHINSCPKCKAAGKQTPRLSGRKGH